MEKDRSQRRHLYGCSPVCVLKCRVKLAERGNTFPQNLHVYLLQNRNKFHIMSCSTRLSVYIAIQFLKKWYMFLPASNFPLPNCIGCCKAIAEFIAWRESIVEKGTEWIWMKAGWQGWERCRGVGKPWKGV